MLVTQPVRIVVFVAVCAAVALNSEFADAVVVPPASQRFSQPSDEVPHLRRHVIPLLSRLGCSAAACHGAKDGQAGFQLSLFGFDFAADHVELTSDGDPPRADWKAPTESAILQKPTSVDAHEGGKRYEPGGWEYNLLLKWIKAGVPGVSPRDISIEIERLHVEPDEAILTSEGDRQPLRVTAHWTDGSVEDVTPLCRFKSNDDGVAVVSAEGVLRRTAVGDTHAVVFYDQAITSIPVLAPQDGVNATTGADLADRTLVDQLVEEKLSKLGIRPSPVCSDETYLRRVRLDLTGTLPSAAEVRRFVSSSDPQKRGAKIDELFESEEYAAWQTTLLCDLTGANEQHFRAIDDRPVQARRWYDWLHYRVRRNVPYDEIVEGIVCGTSRAPGTSYQEYWEEMSAYARGENLEGYKTRETLPLFWARFDLRSPANKALAFSHAFLGVRIQCAECHKHPFDRWTKEDFDGLKAFFEPVQNGFAPDAIDARDRFVAANLPKRARKAGRYLPKMASEGAVVPWKEIYYGEASRRKSKTKTPAGFFREDVDPRERESLQILMDWMRGLDHPYLALAYVNRVWAGYFGHGIVDPPDDLSLANPPSNRPLLDYLAAGFIESGYDMKWLHGEIVLSDAYQRDWRPNSSNEHDQRNYSRAIPRRLPAEVLYDAVWVATAARQEFAISDFERRTIGVNAGLMRSNGRSRFLVNLGKPARDAVCENERSNEASLNQAFFLQNDREIQDMLTRKSGWVAAAAHREDFISHDATTEEIETLIEEAYLRTLSRWPAREEIIRCGQFFEESATMSDAMRGIIWALINTKEFCTNH